MKRGPPDCNPLPSLAMCIHTHAVMKVQLQFLRSVKLPLWMAQSLQLPVKGVKGSIIMRNSTTYIYYKGPYNRYVIIRMYKDLAIPIHISQSKILL